jgi:Transglutaminase-like superfamily
VLSVPQMVSHQIYLHSHAYLCSSGHYQIILDLKNDDYLCISKEHFDNLSPWLADPNTAVADKQRDADPMPAEITAMVRDLLDRGILTADRRQAKAAAQTSFSPPTNALFGIDEKTTGEFSLPQMVQFFWACAKADYSLRRQPIERIVRSVEATRPGSHDGQVKQNIGKTKSLIGAFNALRLSFPRKYLCLFDSLALLNFLAAYGVKPSWVFGVCAEPFAAHCWLQEGETVLNDSMANVCSYTPIMAI